MLTENSGDSFEGMVQFVRGTLPQSKSILNLHIKNPPGVISFCWHEREYLVNKAMEVFEVKGKDLFVTGTSLLMQATLLKRKKTENITEAANESLSQVEGFFKRSEIEKGLTLLESVKKALGGLILRRPAMAANGNRGPLGVARR